MKYLLSCVLAASTALLLLASAPAQAGDKFAWPPIPAEDLALKEVPAHPGLSAVILDYDSFTDDSEGVMRQTVRLKILTEQGRDHANIEIPYWKDWQKVSDLRARVIKPDGAIVPFSGQVYEKLLGKKSDVQLLAKTFSFPDVQVGSILEYHYEITGGHYWGVEWLLGEDLFVRRLRYVCRPRMGYAMTWYRLPQKPVEAPGGKLITLEMNNVEPFTKEEFTPPVKELKSRVNILYGYYKSVDEFWREVAKSSAESVNGFIGENRGGVRRVVEQTIQPSDAPDDKLRKLYARAQQIRNLTYEPEREWKQIEKEHLDKKIDNVDEVLKYGFGRSWMVTRTFVAMARAAGFSADVIEVSERDDHFFDRNLLSGRQFDGELARVRLENRYVFLDPGTPYCPFGLVRWFKTGVTGLVPAKTEANFIDIPGTRPEGARIVRKINLDLAPDGAGKGTAEISYYGQEALEVRLNHRNDDEAARKKALEERLKKRLPAGSTVKLEKITGWEKAEETLRVAYSFEIPELGTHTGKRWLVPANLYQVNNAHPFESTGRLFPVYFDYPYQSVDEVTITVPEGYTVESLPAAKQNTLPFGEYHVQVDKVEERKLRTVRRILMNEVYFETKRYSALRALYSEVGSGDGLQVVLRAASH